MASALIWFSQLNGKYTKLTKLDDFPIPKNSKMISVEQQKLIFTIEDLKDKKIDPAYKLILKKEGWNLDYSQGNMYIYLKKNERVAMELQGERVIIEHVE